MGSVGCTAGVGGAVPIDLASMPASPVASVPDVFQSEVGGLVISGSTVRFVH